MQTTRTIPALFALLLLLVPAGLRAQTGLGVSVQGGLTFAAGDEGDNFGTGPNFALRTVVPLSERLAIQTTVGYQELRVRQDNALVSRGYDPSTFRLGGGFMEGGNRRALGALVQGQLHLLPRSGRFSPYVLAGAGISQVRVTDFGIYFLGRWDDEPGTSEIVPAADVGAGVQLRVARVVSFFAQGSYQMLFTEGGSTTMIPGVIGIMIEMGR